VLRACHVISGPYHYGIALSRVEDERPPVWRVPAKILNKQSRTADKGRSSSLGVGRVANNSSPRKCIVVTKYLETKPRTWSDTLVRSEQRKNDIRFDGLD
jgi:hypothetical protein